MASRLTPTLRFNGEHLKASIPRACPDIPPYELAMSRRNCQQMWRDVLDILARFTTNSSTGNYCWHRSVPFDSLLFGARRKGGSWWVDNFWRQRWNGIIRIFSTCDIRVYWRVNRWLRNGGLLVRFRSSGQNMCFGKLVPVESNVAVQTWFCV
jgi:hypothetical protein